MKNCLVIAVAAVLFNLCSASWAEGSIPAASKKSGAYVGGGLGYSSFDINHFATPGINKDTPFIFGHREYNSGGLSPEIHVGYLFDVAKDFLLGLELGYIFIPGSFEEVRHSGPFSWESSHIFKTNYKGYHVPLFLGVGKYYFKNRYSLFTKFGGAYVSQSVSYSHTENYYGGTNTESAGASTNKVLPVVGGGIGFRLNPNIEFTATYLHGFGDDSSSQHILDVGVDKALTLVPSFNSYILGMDYFFK